MTSTEPRQPAPGPPGSGAPAPDARPAPVPPGPPARTSTHGRGNWRSLVISMVIMTAVVFVIVALMPRPAQRERATVDVARAASQLSAEKGWALATLDAGEDWHPTSVSLTPDDKGVPTWTVGYHHRPGDDRYVVLTQTRRGDGVGEEQLTAWLNRQAKTGREEGTVQAGGATWTRRAATVGDDAQRVHRSLVARGPDAPGGLVTVLAGEASYGDLERLAATLRPRTVPAAPSGIASAR